MTDSKAANLVVIPTPGIGHLVPAVEQAKHLVARDSRLTVTILLIKLPVPDDKLESYVHSLKSNPSLLQNGVVLIEMPILEPTSYEPRLLILYIESYQSKVKDAVNGLRAAGPVVAGLLLDMFCSPMFDVAADLGLPSYLFFTCGASLLRMMFHLNGLGVDVTEEYDVVRSPETALEIPGFRNPVPVSVWPGLLLEKGNTGFGGFLRHVDKYRKAKGILVNTFTELERDLIESMLQDSRIPPIYPVGPMLHLATDDGSSDDDPIMRWLDAQPPKSVVFLCFGSRGAFKDTQVKQIAAGLERSGRRFLWSLRQRSNNQADKITPPSDLDDPSSVLPEGFLERTGERGRVIGWAPQARVLAHVAVGVFVSHCGWNSTLESFWYGVPIAAWPIYAEQQLNAFVLVRELGLATEVRLDYRQDFGIDMVVEAAEVEEGIQKAMEETAAATEVRKKVEEMSDRAKKALEEGGSSYECLGRFIEGLFENLP